MNFEQKNFQFNIETFRNDFNSLFSKYRNTLLNLRFHMYNPFPPDEEPDLERSELEKKKLLKEKDALISELRLVSVDALKASDNKQEILDIISSAYLDIESELGDEYEGEKEFFKKLIPELLK